jgi:hypothetical protein
MSCHVMSSVTCAVRVLSEGGFPVQDYYLLPAHGAHATTGLRLAGGRKERRRACASGSLVRLRIDSLERTRGVCYVCLAGWLGGVGEGGEAGDFIRREREGGGEAPVQGRLRGVGVGVGVGVGQRGYGDGGEWRWERTVHVRRGEMGWTLEGRDSIRPSEGVRAMERSWG